MRAGALIQAAASKFIQRGRNKVPQQNFITRNFANEKDNEQKEGYLSLSVSTPQEQICSKEFVKMVQISTTDGVESILANHASQLAEQEPGVQSIHKEDMNVASQEYFVPAGFAVIQSDNNTANIVVTDAIPLQDLDATIAKRNLEEATNNLAKYKEGTEYVENLTAFKVLNPLVRALENVK